MHETFDHLVEVFGVTHAVVMVRAYLSDMTVASGALQADGFTEAELPDLKYLVRNTRWVMEWLLVFGSEAERVLQASSSPSSS